MIKRYVDLGNALNATALNAIGTRYVCLLNATELNIIDSNSLKWVKYCDALGFLQKHFPISKCIFLFSPLGERKSRKQVIPPLCLVLKACCSPSCQEGLGLAIKLSLLQLSWQQIWSACMLLSRGKRELIKFNLNSFGRLLNEIN